jgi:hypothetical protein
MRFSRRSDDRGPPIGGLHRVHHLRSLHSWSNTCLAQYLRCDRAAASNVQTGSITEANQLISARTRASAR